LVCREGKRNCRISHGSVHVLARGKLEMLAGNILTLEIEV